MTSHLCVAGQHGVHDVVEGRLEAAGLAADAVVRGQAVRGLQLQGGGPHRGAVALRPRDDDLRPPRHQGAHVVRHEGVDVAVLVLVEQRGDDVMMRVDVAVLVLVVTQRDGDVMTSER